MVQELGVAYRSIAWAAAIGGYLWLRYEQWLPAAGYLVGAGVAALALWSLQQLAGALGTTARQPWRWWWRGALWRYPLLLLTLWLVSRQPAPFVMGFTVGVTLLPLGVAMLALSRRWQRPAWLTIRYWSPKTPREFTTEVEGGYQQRVGRASR
ncbi:MAG: hypothetical protein RMM06_10625 [Armatimonadota bacterium]|nr:hypothetical protein [bacterium]MCS7309888.1 hypothetical protein [Armatimonadota bacterium]MDW8105511.1 hypothetical protein [Armatimonadota bacterium]MDW8291169.1 hypothetical protein [Armatimonadota bacterium]